MTEVISRILPGLAGRREKARMSGSSKSGDWASLIRDGRRARKRPKEISELGVTRREWRSIIGTADLGDSLYDLGAIIWAHDGEESTAIQIFEEASRHGDEAARHALGAALVWMGRFDEGVTVLRQMSAENALPSSDRLLLARALVGTGADLGEAEDLLRGMSDDEEDAAPDLAILLIAQGRLDEARRVLEHAVALGNRNAPIVLGNLLTDYLDDPEGAESAYRTGMDRGDAFAGYNLGLLLLSQDRTAEAMESIEWAASHGASSADEFLKQPQDDGSVRYQA